MFCLKSWKTLVCVLGFVLGAAVYSYSANVPRAIHYQGILNNKNGTPANGPFNMTFSIYSSVSGGTPLWTESWSSSATPANPVIVANGAFNVMLGVVNPIPSDFFANNTKTYLGTKVGNDSELVPRQQILSVGYAFAAGNGIPKGGIIIWSGAMNRIPEGWALCDGTNGTPDLRNRFIVGAGSGYAVGATGGEAAHVLTITEMPSHAHTQNPHTHTQNPHQHTMSVNGSDGSTRVRGGGTGTQYSGIGLGVEAATATNQSATATNQNTGGGQAHENRPPYYALAFIMKL